MSGVCQCFHAVRVNRVRALREGDSPFSLNAIAPRLSSFLPTRAVILILILSGWGGGRRRAPSSDSLALRQALERNAQRRSSHGARSPSIAPFFL